MLVLVAPLGLLTNAVQTLAGILLARASVLLVLLCHDKELLGPWVSGMKFNIFTSMTVGALVILSAILTGSLIFPDMREKAILSILGGGGVVGLLAGEMMMFFGHGRAADTEMPINSSFRDSWRIAPLR